MMGQPLNDRACLDQVAARALEFSEDEGRELVVELGLRSVPELFAFVRQLPQRNDNGDPDDGPKIACDVLQRLRLPTGNPNCVERTALVVALGEVLAPGSVWQMATIDTPTGRHTYPTQDGRPVDVDPYITQPELEVAQFALRQAAGAGHSVGDIAELVGGLALRTCNTADEPRVRDGLAALHGLEAGVSPPRNQLDALGFTLGLAQRAARSIGPQGVSAVNLGLLATEQLIAGLRNADKDASELISSGDRRRIAKRVRKKKRRRRTPRFGFKIGGLTIAPDVEFLGKVGKAAANVGTRVASRALQATLAQAGISPDLIRATEAELQKEGLTLGPLVPPETKSKASANPLDLLLLAAVL